MTLSTITSVLVPLYIYPLENQIPEVWGPLLNAIEAFPKLRFIVIINPNSGPGGRPILPDEQYQLAIPYFQRFSNVTLLGYVRTDYAKRDFQVVKDEIEIYSQWHEQSMKEEGSGSGLGLDGIFLDEVSWSENEVQHYETISDIIRNARWRSAAPGYIVLNPGCQPHSRYFATSDMVVIFENHHHNFILEEGVALPQPSPLTPPQKWGVMIHDFGVSRTKEDKITEMKGLIHDMVQMRGVGALFITDVEIAKADVYDNWSSVWAEFIDIMAETVHSASFLY